MLTTADLRKASNDERWLGFGYLGERARQDDLVLCEAVDQRIIDAANDAGWEYEDLFAWANSKLGRWLGDAMFGSSVRFDRRWDNAVRDGLLAHVARED